MLNMRLVQYCKCCKRNLPDGWKQWQTCPRCGYALWDNDGKMRWMGWRVKYPPPPPPIRPRVRLELVSADEKRDGRTKTEERVRRFRELQRRYPDVHPIQVRLSNSPYVVDYLCKWGEVWVPEAEITKWVNDIQSMGIEIDVISLETAHVKPRQLKEALKDLEQMKQDDLDYWTAANNAVSYVEPEQLVELLQEIKP